MKINLLVEFDLAVFYQEVEPNIEKKMTLLGLQGLRVWEVCCQKERMQLKVLYITNSNHQK